MKNRNELPKYFQEHFQTGLGVEVGVQNGFFSQEILKEWKGVLKCVDIWTNKQNYETAKQNLGIERMIKGGSAAVSREFDDESLDFLVEKGYHKIADTWLDSIFADEDVWQMNLK